MDLKQKSTKQIVKEITEGFREGCSSYIGEPLDPLVVKRIKATVSEVIKEFKNDPAYINIDGVKGYAEELQHLMVDSPTSKLLPEHPYLDLEDHILSELPWYEDGSKIWKHVRPSPYEGIIVAECPYEQIPAKEYEEIQEYIMTTDRPGGFVEMGHDYQDRDIAIGSGDLKIGNSGDPMFEHAEQTEPAMYIHTASTGNIQWEASGTGEVEVDDKEPTNSICWRDNEFMTLADGKWVEVAKVHGLPPKDYEEVAEELPSAEGRGWLALSSAGYSIKEPEDPHKGMVQNPITGEWKWL